MFHREPKRQKKNLIQDWTLIQNPSQFLLENKRPLLLERIQALCDLEPVRYKSLCVALMNQVVEYAQSLPETTNSYYSQPGGVVEFALNRTEASLSLFKEWLVLNEASLSPMQLLWQYVLYSAALLKGIGKLFVDYDVQLFSQEGKALKTWNPLLNSMQEAHAYQYEFKTESSRSFRRRVNLLLVKQLMPAEGFAWIAAHPDVLEVWLALLNEDEADAGTLGALLIRAEALALERYFADMMNKGHSQFIGGRYGRSGTFSGGGESLLDKERAVGLEFLQWLQQALESGQILLNKAPLFMVPGGMLMCQELFQLFVREHPEYKNWQLVQNGFLSLGLHGQAAGSAITSRFEQAQTQQIYTGVIFEKYAMILPASLSVQSQTGKSEKMSALEVIHASQQGSSLNALAQTNAIVPLEKLNANGQWQADIKTEALQAGVKSRG